MGPLGSRTRSKWAIGNGGKVVRISVLIIALLATLTAYGGVPAFWARTPADRTKPGIILSFAEIDGRWRVFDVANDVIYRTRSGDLAAMDDLRGHEELVPDSVRDLQIDGVSYLDIATHAAMPPIPHPLRAELQMPLPRMWHEMKSAVGLERVNESDR